MSGGFQPGHALYPGGAALAGDDLGHVVPAAMRIGYAKPEPTVAAAIDAQGVLVFALFSSMLFIARMGTYGAVLFTAAALMWAVWRWDDLLDVMRRRWFLLLLPLYAVLSSAWSDVPLETLRHSGELFITIMAALLLGARGNARSVFLGLFAAFAVYIAVSVAVGTTVDIGMTGTTAVAGLNDSKNEQADTAATGFLISVAAFFMGVKLRSVLQCAIAAAAAAVEIYATIAAVSTGALAGLAVATCVFFVMLAFAPAGRISRAAIVGIGGGVSALLAAAFVLFRGDMVQWAAQTFAKDSTLTGRTYLWSRAQDLIVEKPLFGRGFAAFWQHGNLDAEGLWQFAQITNRTGFNFHSTIYDCLVEVGWIGFLLFMATLLVGLAMLAVNYTRKPSVLASFWIAMAVLMLVRMPVESIGLSEFYFSTVLLFALLAWKPQDATATPFTVGRASFAPPQAYRGASGGRSAVR